MHDGEKSRLELHCNFTLALLEYTKSGEQINNNNNNNNEKKLGFPVFKPAEPLLFPLLLFLYQINRYKNKCGGDLQAQLTHIQRSPNNTLHKHQTIHYDTKKYFSISCD